jgi:hypothetical protein
VSICANFLAFSDSQQRVKIRQGVLQARVENHDLAGDFFTSKPQVIFRADSEVTAQQFEQRQVSGGFAVGERVGFERQQTLTCNGLEFVEEPGFSYSWFTDRCNDLAVPTACEF